MAKIDIISQGDIGKFQLIIERDGFDPRTCDFKMNLSWGFYGEHVEIKKEEMFHDEDWNVFFMFDSNKMLGMITAECEYWVADSDMAMPDGDKQEEWFRVNVDRQLLCLVSTSATARLPKGTCKCPCAQEHQVHYKRMLESDVNTLYLIVRVEGEIVRTSDDKIVRVRKQKTL